MKNLEQITCDGVQLGWNEFLVEINDGVYSFLGKTLPEGTGIRFMPKQGELFIAKSIGLEEFHSQLEMVKVAELPPGVDLEEEGPPVSWDEFLAQRDEEDDHLHFFTKIFKIDDGFLIVNFKPKRGELFIVKPINAQHYIDGIETQKGRGHNKKVLPVSTTIH